MAAPIQLLNLFTWVAPAAGGSFFLPWFRWPTDYGRAELWISTKLHDGVSGLHFNVWSSMDMDDQKAVVQVNVAGAGLAINSITANLGQYVRVQLESGVIASRVALSAWLVPKRA